MGYAYGIGLGLASRYSRCIGTDTGGFNNGRIGYLGHSQGLDGIDWLDTQSAHWIISDYIAALLVNTTYIVLMYKSGIA